MSSLTPDNPYASPRVDPRDASGQSQTSVRQGGALRCAAWGFLTGGGVGVIIGGMCAFVVGVLAAAVVYKDSTGAAISWTTSFYAISAGFVAAIMGAVYGLFWGALLGTGLGILAGAWPRPIPRLLVWLSMPICAAAGGFGGFIGAGVLCGFSANGAWVIVSGSVLGLAAGVLGGWLLARYLSRLAWPLQFVVTSDSLLPQIVLAPALKD